MSLFGSKGGSITLSKDFIEEFSVLAEDTAKKIYNPVFEDDMTEEEMLLLTTGLAGMACAKSYEALGKSVKAVKSKNGKTYYTSSSLDDDIFAPTDSMLETMNKAYGSIFPHAHPDSSMVIKNTKSFLKEDYLIAGLYTPSEVYAKVAECWDRLYPELQVICPSPENWPAYFSLVLKSTFANSLIGYMDLKPELIFARGLENAIIISRMRADSV